MESGRDEASRQSRARLADAGQAVAAAAILASLLAPIWLHRLPPSVDYPTHAARAFVLSRPAGSGGVLDFYAADWIPVPNLGVDIVLSALMRLLDPWVASSLFLTAVVLVLLSGGVAWARSLGAPWTGSLLPAAVLGDTWYRMGFVNYVLGIGLSAWAMAAWVRWRGLERGPLAVRGASIAVGLAVVHLLAALVFVALALVDSWLEGRQRRPVPAWAWVAAPAALAGAALSLGALGKTPWNWQAKLLAFQGLGRWFEFRPQEADGLLGGVLVAILATCFLVPAAPRFAAWALASGAALGPSFAAGTAFSSERLTLPMTLVLAVHAHRARAASSLCGFLLPVAALLALGEARNDIAESDRGQEVLALARRHVRPGDTVLTFETGIPERPTTSRDHLHFADWLVLDGVFVPQLFAKPGQQPLRFTPAAAPFKAFQGQEPIPRLPTTEDIATASRLQSNLGNGRPAYFLVFGLPARVQIPGLQCIEASRRGNCALYRVLP